MDFLQQHKIHIENLLLQALASNDRADGCTHLDEAMRYAVLNGGKRIRASLCYAVGKLGNPPPPALDALAMAVEIFHAYSLVHDDLPAMDDDDLRRGQPSCHVAYDEATAILAGDALQSLGFEILAQPQTQVSPELQLTIIRRLACAIGGQGMAGGQSLDLRSEGKNLTHASLAQIHRLKTGALLEATITSAGLLTLESQADQLLLSSFGSKLGLTFQIMDDILEATSSTLLLGKPANSDEKNDKATYPKLMGLEAAKQEALTLYDQALNDLSGLGEKSVYLREIVRVITQAALIQNQAN